MQESNNRFKMNKWFIFISCISLILSEDYYILIGENKFPSLIPLKLVFSGL